MSEQPEPIELALRCYTEQTKEKPIYEDPWKKEEEDVPSRVLVFDTETTTDQYQNLKFGSFRAYEHGTLRHEGIFYGENLKDNETAILKQYAEDHHINIGPVREFVDKVFLPEVYGLRTLCVGFNLPFDISRLAISFGNSRKERGGFSFKLSENQEYPRILIKHIDGKRSFIKFANGFSGIRGNMRNQRGHPNNFRGQFLDLKTLAFALTSESQSLESACKHFKSETGKTHPEGHGKVTPEYIDYNINDVEATYALYLKMMEAYSKYHLDCLPTKVYSPASIGKAYLKQMGIKSFSDKNPDFPKELLGSIMTTYYGGRSEVRTRKKPVEITLIDFLSMYPTVCTLQNLWPYVICENIEYFDDTQNVKRLVDDAKLETFSDKEKWKELPAIVQIEPSEDILPVRTNYGEEHAYNIGVNYLSSGIPVGYALADVVASKLLTGKTPKILKAIRFRPVGIQEGLREIEIIGDKKINPEKRDFFKTLIEYRNEIKSQPKTDQSESLQNSIKTITNASSYGIFVEINVESAVNPVEVNVYGNESFNNKRKKVEKFGNSFNPIMAVFITSAARLVLAITEAILQKHGETYAFCDTDSMAIPPEHLKEIQDFFQKLSPYSFSDPLFKLEKENFGDDGKTLKPLLFYGVSAKRYVLYNLENGKIRIRKYSLHGLGHILNPFDNDSEDWQEQVWLDILNEHHGLVGSGELSKKYSHGYAISKMAVTSPHVMRMFKKLNKGKPYDKQIKPFNFMIVGIANQQNPDTANPIKPIAPYTKNPRDAPYAGFVDYHTGELMEGIQYWKPLDSLFQEYKDHKESKSDGDLGILNRKHLFAESIIHIGKEADNIEESEVIGINDESYQVYSNGKTSTRLNVNSANLILNMDSGTAKKYGISESNLRYWKSQITEGKPIRVSRKNRTILSKIKRSGDLKTEEDLKQFILNLDPSVASQYGIPEVSMRRWKREIKAGRPIKIRNGNRERLKRGMWEIRDRRQVSGK